MGLKGLMERMRRILLVANKPDKGEYRQSAKITGIGAALIGVIGFVIFIVIQLIGGL